ncbi:MAG: hypothetical protein ABF743_11325 [Schleiferilactobacillus perolens]|jgi:hypothetical protein|uniref:hypothetical protein n=1 Tax=Schleiferilactobacillus perolens TaxID=100468 RepID=UPI0039E977E9|nr:hypothetical protein [Schleiferilactobacillus harbinensis]MCI1913962.1 hypothetical protein [Schleiferilactobacillus harbinensis]
MKPWVKLLIWGVVALIGFLSWAFDPGPAGFPNGFVMFLYRTLNVIGGLAVTVIIFIVWNMIRDRRRQP